MQTDLKVIEDKLLSSLLELRGNEIPAEASKLKTQVKECLGQLHGADIANILESLEPELRALVWQMIDSPWLVGIIEDMSDAAAMAMMAEIPDEVLAKGLASTEDVEDVEGVLRDMPPKRRAKMLELSGLSNNHKLLESLSFAPDTVGSLMDFKQCSILSSTTVGDTIKLLHERKELPPHSDKLLVIDKENRLVGIMPLKRLFIHDHDSTIENVMVKRRLHSLTPDVGIDEAIDFFERYDLISAPVLNASKQVLGRVTIDEILAILHEERHADLLSSTGLREEEDLYAPLLTRLRNRGFWIFINLISAFLVSRLVGTFEGTIVQVVALASLMPIIASMAGNAGLQTSTMLIRAIALNQLHGRNWLSLLANELTLGAVSGVLWGVLVGLFGFLFYQDLKLSLVLTVSMTVVFVMGATAGFLVPIVANYLRKDPALGTAVIVTTVTDCLGFFVFLGLATGFLL